MGDGLRIAVVGCGLIGGVHSMLLRGLRMAGVVDDVVVAACDADRSRAEMYAASHGADMATTDPEEALAVCDVVWICTPTAFHLPVVERAAALGRAVYCEKPLAPDLVGARRLVAVVEAAGIAVQVGLVLRHAPAVVAVTDVLGSGRLGTPMAAALTDDQYFPIQGQYASGWRADVAQAGGGTLIEHSIHDLDMLGLFLGPVDTVDANTANFAGHPGVEDVAAVTLRHESGATSSLTSVWHSILTRPSTRRLTIFCERGIVSLDDEHVGPVTVKTDDGVEELPATMTPEQEAIVDQVVAAVGLPEIFRANLASYVLADHDFLVALHTGRAPYPGLDVAMVAHELVDAAYRGAGQRTGHA